MKPPSPSSTSVPPRVLKILAVCFFFTAVLFWRPLVGVLSEPFSVSRQVVDFHAERATPPVVKGDVSRTSDGVLRCPAGSREGIGFVFDVKDPGRVTVQLAARSAGGPLELAIESRKGVRHIVARRHGLRHRAFDLSPYIAPDHDWTFRVRSLNGEALEIREVAIRQSPSNRFPRIHFALLAFVPLFLFVAAFRRRLGPKTAAISVGAIALAVRWRELAAWIAQPLQGDATFYHQIAEGFSWSRPYGTGMREPLQVWLQAAFMDAGLGLMATRLLSVVTSGLSSALIVLLGARLFGTGAGCVAGLLFAFGDFQVWNALRGERAETYLFLVLTFLTVLVSTRDDARKRIDALLGVLAGLAGLTWLIGVPAACLAYAVRLRWHSARWSRAALFALPLAVFLFPHLLSQHRVNGDALFALNAHTAFYRSAEATGVPSYEGQGGALARFLVESPGTRAVSLAGGYGSIFIDPRAPFNRIFLGFHYGDARALLFFPFLLIGLATAVRRRNWLVFWLLFAVINVSPTMLSAVRDPRLFLFAAPFVALFFGAGVSMVWTGILALRQRWKG